MNRYWLPALIAGAMLVQLVMLVPQAELKAQADEIRYQQDGGSILQGWGLPHLMRPPGYPYMIALSRAVAPERTPLRLSVGVGQIVVSGITMVLLYLLGIELYDRRVGLLAAGLFGFYPPIAAQTHLIWSEPFMLLPLTTALLLSIRARKSGRLSVALAAGAAFGASALTREFAFWFVPVASLWLAATWAGRRRALAGAVVIVGAFLVILPWTARNYRIYGNFVLIAANSWTPLYLGNNADPPPDVWSFYRDHWRLDLVRERVARERAFAYIAKRQPWWIFERLRVGVPELLSTESHILRHVRLGWYGPMSPIARWVVLIVMVTSYLALLLAFAFGVSATRWNADRILILLFMLYAAAIVLPFNVVARYRIPLEAFGCLFAACCLAHAEARARLRGKRLVAALAIAATLVGCAVLGGMQTLGEVIHPPVNSTFRPLPHLGE